LVGLVVSLACLIGVPTAAAAPSHRADGNLSDWSGVPTMLAGETRVSQGELIHDDYLYDDYGADINGGANQPDFRSNLAPTRGDYRYPAANQTEINTYGYNAADLREFRVAADSRGLHLLVFLQTMKVPDATAVTVAIDDNRNRRGSDEWPFGAGIASPVADQFITFWGTGGWVSDWRGNHSQITRQAYNLDENAIEVDVPWSALGRSLRGRKVDNLYIVSGLADAAQRQYRQVPLQDGGAPGSTAVFDSGFDDDEFDDLTTPGAEIGSHWGEDLQAQRLADRDVSAMGSGEVDLGALERGVTVPYTPETGHFYDRIFKSSRSYSDQGELCTPGPSSCVNEGVRLKNNPSTPGGSPDAQFLSPYQPYGLYIPADYQPGTQTPLLINGHSLDVNHNEYAVVSPGLFAELGDDCDQPPTPGAEPDCPAARNQGRLVITPLARGLDTWYITSGFEDVMEAWADVKSNYSSDDERTWIGGYSMGGYMTYRMGLLMPDRFAAAAAYVPPAAYQLWEYPLPPQGQPSTYVQIGWTTNIVSNGLNLPYEINNGGADELVPPSGAQEQARHFRSPAAIPAGVWGNPHRFYFYPELDHFALIGIDQWDHTRDFLDQYLQRNLSPDEVRYRRYPAMDLPQYGHRFDGAYWVDGMATRNPASDTCSPGQSCQTQFGQVTAYTRGHGREPSTAVDFNDALPGPPSATIQGTDRIPGGPLGPGIDRNVFEAALTNLKAIAFDTAGMGIDPSDEITASLTAAEAGPFTLTLKGAFPAVSATLDGQSVQVQQVAGGIEISFTFTPGVHSLVITPQ
jgi:hypothetical protein